MTGIRRLRAAIALIVLAVFATGPATAQDPKPTPTSCAGLTFTDPAGDAKIAAAVLAGQPIGPPGETPKNLDLLSGFFRYAPDATGKNIMTFNIEVAVMDKTVAAGFEGATWTLYWMDGETQRFVRAVLEGDAFTYEYGTRTVNSHAVEGTTTGKIFEGEKGIVQIVFPAALKLDGKTLTGPFAEARALGGGFVFPTDRGPDEETGKDIKANPCAEAGVPTQTGGGGGGGGTTPPPGGGGTTPPPGGTTQQPAAVTLKVTAPKLSAKKLKKGKKITVTVQSSGEVKNLTATLKKGKKTVAAGKLASLNGTGKLSLKVSAKKLKKGGYTLSLNGTDTAGRAVTGLVQIKIGK